MDHRSESTEWPFGGGGIAAYRLLIGSWAQAFWETDAHGVVIADSPSWRAYTGQTLQEWLGDGWLGAIHPDDRAHAERQWREAIAAHRVVNAEFRLRAPDGGWRWTNVRAVPMPNDKGDIGKWAGINIDIDARKRAEATLRDSQERQVFLLGFNDALRKEPSADAVANRALRMLSDQLGLDRCYIAIYRVKDDVGEFPYQVHNDRLPPLPAALRLSDFPEALKIVTARTLVIDDVREYEGLSENNRANIEQLGVRALVNATLRKGENNPLWALIVGSMQPRVWTQSEISLVEEVAERTWAAIKRARAEKAVRESEIRLRALFASIDQGFMEVEVEINSEGRAVDWRYVALNPSFERLTGMDDVTGRLASEVFPDREPEWAERYAQVVTTGESMRFELPAAAIGRWFDINLVNVGGAGTCRIAVVYDDITDRKRAEAVLRENEARQAFLLKLSDALRVEPSADAAGALAARLLAEELEADRCHTIALFPVEDRADTINDFRRTDITPLPATFALSAFPDALKQLSENTLVVDDVAADSRLADVDRRSLAAIDQGALIAPAMRRGPGMPIWSLCIGSKLPRHWTATEIALVEDAAERTWAAMERARAEAARVQAEESFTRLFEASPAPLLVLAPDAPQFTITEVNEAYLAATMRTREELVGQALFEAFPDNPNDPTSTSVGSLRASLDRVLAARQPDKLPALKYDIPHPDGTFEERWWSPVNSPILDDKGEVETIIHSAIDVTEARRYQQHLGLLLAELQHRVRNILTMVRSVARRTADNCHDVPDYVRHLDGRLAALARVQTILTRDPSHGVDLHGMVLDELESQAASPVHYRIEGPEVELSAKAAEVLSLAIHELATNSIKYGILSKSSGTIQIRWTVEDRDGQSWLRWTWHEPVGSTIDRPSRTGFGTELIVRRVPYELRGTGQLSIGDGAVEARIEFPLANEPKKLESAATDKDVHQ